MDGQYQTMSVSSARDIDQGLGKYMRGVYNRMAGGLAVTGLVAWWAAAVQLPLMLGLLWIFVALLPFAFVLVMSFGMNRISNTTANVLFWAFSATMGVSLSTIFVIYTSASIAQVFFITAGTFAAASLYGYTTGRDLTTMGGILIMGLIGIILASIVNIFLASSMMTFIISLLAVVIFTGLTAYDTQKLKEEYLGRGEVYGFDSPEKSAIFGALGLYLNFVNIFQMLLNLLGDRD